MDNIINTISLSITRSSRKQMNFILTLFKEKKKTQPISMLAVPHKISAVR